VSAVLKRSCFGIRYTHCILSTAGMLHSLPFMDN
jgi:hypothetical protein